MDRPDWCPQDVWDEATGWTEAMHSVQATGLADKWTPVPIIARAILAAKAEEREDVARLVEDYEPDLKPWDGPTERANARSATDYACIDIAAAIRKRANS